MASLLRRHKCGQPTAAEKAYQTALRLERQGQAGCVDYYFVAATHCWPFIESSSNLQTVHPRALEIYNSSLRKILTTGSRFQRLDPRVGLRVNFSEGSELVPIQHSGFVWQPRDFDHVEPIGHYYTSELNNTYRCQGLGISTLATRCLRPGEKYRNEQQRFGCTMLLKPEESGFGATRFVIEFLDPLRVEQAIVHGRPFAITRDRSAPFAFALANSEQKEWERFLRPGFSEDSDGLIMIEPFQPNKIPLIFVHGLLSSRFTWASLANELAANPKILERYQLWGFEYATGEPFLESAAVLRRQLGEIQRQYDPTNQNKNLRRAVLIGHSMGGLISKLMITDSSDCLWSSVSHSPIESIHVNEQTRFELIQSFFFQPQQMVSRVVYIGTPHRGSPLAHRPIGKLAASLVDPPTELERIHQKLMVDNPGNWSNEFAKRIPNSVDLLRPDSPLLRAIDRLPVNPRVSEHSIVGFGFPTVGALDSDTVVPVRNANRVGVKSHLRVRATHTKLHKDGKTVAEVLAILNRHLME